MEINTHFSMLNSIPPTKTLLLIPIPVLSMYGKENHVILLNLAVKMLYLDIFHMLPI